MNRDKDGDSGRSRKHHHGYPRLQLIGFAGRNITVPAAYERYSQHEIQKNGGR